MKKNKKIFLLLLGWGISIAILILILGTAPPDEIWGALRQANPLYILAAMAFASASILFRGGRWARLFMPEYEISAKNASSLVSIGLAINALFPGRIGDLARLGLAVKRFNTGLAYTTATIVAERLLDGITLLIFLGLSLILLPALDANQSVELFGQVISGEIVINVLRTLALICLLLLLGIIFLLMPKSRELMHRFLDKTPIIGKRFQKLEKHLFHDMRRGFSALQDPKLLFRLLLDSCFIWLLLVIAYLLVSMGMDDIQLTFFQAMAVMSISIAVSSIPSAPGAWGVFEAGALLTLTMLGLEFDQAIVISYVLIIHASQYIPVVLLGLIAALKEHVSLRKIRKTANTLGDNES